MKTAISIPDELFKTAERLAKRLGVSRSELYATAIRDFLDRKRGDRVTERLDAVYEGTDSTLDPSLARMQAASIGADGW